MQYNPLVVVKDMYDVNVLEDVQMDVVHAGKQIVFAIATAIQSKPVRIKIDMLPHCSYFVLCFSNKKYIKKKMFQTL